jgi:hypothetical protein
MFMSCQWKADKIIIQRYKWTAYSLEIWQKVEISGNNTNTMKISFMRKLKAY